MFEARQKGSPGSGRAHRQMGKRKRCANRHETCRYLAVRRVKRSHAATTTSLQGDRQHLHLNATAVGKTSRLNLIFSED
ncbi:hypothetical protein REMIM1_PE00321 (plasmid) [Rhizobium etli bv. mimosae str. Mim1]|nr:hypothetical protein REMIM1_PE00321 [Rhizobium etli bv. mimosae str. Mim1]